MTRRAALQLLAAVSGVFTQTLTTAGRSVLDLGPTSLTFYLGQWTEIRVVHKGETIVIGVDELFKALKG